jgi:hypothetical protein
LLHWSLKTVRALHYDNDLENLMSRFMDLDSGGSQVHLSKLTLMHMLSWTSCYFVPKLASIL